MRAALLLSLAISLPLSAGTLFDEDGNKIDVCQGSTCSPGGGGSTPNTVVTVNQDGSVKLSSSNIARGGSASSSSSSTSQGGSAQGGNASAVINNPGTVRYSGSHTVRSVGVAPDIVANPTAPCRISAGVTGGWIGGALGFTGSVLDEGCDTRADATMLWAMGLEGAAVSRLCQKPELTKALGPLCENQISPVSLIPSVH